MDSGHVWTQSLMPEIRTQGILQ